MAKYCLVVFQGEPACLVHVLLNALDMKERGLEPTIVVEGKATKLLPEVSQPEHPHHGLWQKVRDQGLLGAVCQACSQQMGVLEQVRALGLPLAWEMSGHPSLAAYLLQGYQIITF
ncbi:MAG: DsrE family protein [Deltaproteobacteria bacterium]|nr:DsrE family protein [Deltaproteobacteria bacterium]